MVNFSNIGNIWKIINNLQEQFFVNHMDIIFMLLIYELNL